MFKKILDNFRDNDPLEKLEKMNMKFDCVVGNPPFQIDSDNKGAGHTLWDKFVEKSLDITKENGYLALVHPSGWRRISGTYASLGKKMRDKTIRYLEIHSINDGIKTFGVCTRYDWYILQNKSNNNYETEILDEDGKTTKINLSNVLCIPNGEFEKIFNLLGKREEDRVNMIFDRSSYGADKKWVSKEKSNEYKYPCIYSLTQKEIRLVYSNKNTNGHFGVPKVICSYGACPQIIIDEKGEYGLTQWAFGITDEINVLPKIKKALENDIFIGLCKYMRFTLDKYDPNFLKSLKKDFWKEFNL
jgi:hypothetical protein